MADFTGIYLHGFLSSGMSTKGQWFKQQVSQCSSVNSETNQLNHLSSLLTPSYQIASPELSVSQIEPVIIEAMQIQKPVLLIGSSMGGFYARFFAHKYELPYILINPAFQVAALFENYLGKHQNPVTGEAVTINQNYINSLKSYEIESANSQLDSLLLIDKDDEVIDVDFALQFYENKLFTRHQTIVYSGGDHSFIHLDEAWFAMRNFIEKLSN